MTNTQDMKKPEEPSTDRKKGILISAILVTALVLLIIWVLVPMVRKLRNPEMLRVYVEEQGVQAVLLFMLMNLLQTMSMVISAGPFELAAGSLFGTVEGTLICNFAMASGSMIAFLLSRKFGLRFIRMFFSEEKIESIRMGKIHGKENLITWVGYLIPGLPKDFLPYIMGISDMRGWVFFGIVLVARIPSVLLTVMTGDALITGEKEKFIILVAILVVINIGGALLYRRYKKGKQNK